MPTRRNVLAPSSNGTSFTGKRRSNVRTTDPRAHARNSGSPQVCGSNGRKNRRVVQVHSNRALSTRTTGTKAPRGASRTGRRDFGMGWVSAEASWVVCRRDSTNDGLKLGIDAFGRKVEKYAGLYRSHGYSIAYISCPCTYLVGFIVHRRDSGFSSSLLHLVPV
jgi:hypothetical protein